MIHRNVLHNGRIVEATGTPLSPGQLGLVAGWGVFSTLRVADGVLFAYDRHWARMKRDAELLRIPFPESPDKFKNDLLSLVDANRCQNATMRVVVVRNHGGLWEGPGIETEFDVIALTADTNSWGESVALGVVPQARHAANVFAGTKVTAWGHNLCWYEQAHERGFDEVILLNERDEVAECTSANVFAVFGTTVWTPPLTAGCLPGITRALLLEEIKVDGITVEEHALRLENLERADQIFITSTTRGLLPVARVQDLTIRNESDVCAKLHKRFNDYVAEYCSQERTQWISAR